MSFKECVIWLKLDMAAETDTDDIINFYFRSYSKNNVEADSL